uniref:Uncharacterized protein n=1 Tax=Populus trichocarpa TaxID=3694 RepID=A0A3N7FLX2_POPTR
MIEQLDDSYLGCERWLPSRPKVEKPPSVFNAATLAYIDDSIFEDALLQKLLNDNYLSEEERSVEHFLFIYPLLSTDINS